MKKFFFILMIPFIGFSQADCENSILVEALQNENINDFFQGALSVVIEDLAFLDNCQEDINYTLFAPGNNIPTESIPTLINVANSGSEALIDLVSYYIHPETLNFLEFINGEIEMMDGNLASISFTQSIDDYNIMINQANITFQDICTCNGVIHIIDDLIWEPNISSIENQKNSIIIKGNKLDLSTIEYSSIELFDISGKLLYNSNGKENIDLSVLKNGVYILSIQNNSINTYRKILKN